MVIRHGLGGTLIKMVSNYSAYDLPNMTNGMDSAMVGVFAQVPELSAGILMFVWFFIFISGTSMQKKSTNYVDYPQWALMSSIPTLLLSLIFTLREGMIGIEVLSIVVSITIMSGLWFFLSKGRNEV